MRPTSFLTSGALRRGVATSALLSLLVLAGCGGPKGFYAGAAARTERAAAEAATGPAADATLQTQTTYVRLVEQMQRDGLWFASLAHLDALEQRWGTSPVATRLRADALRQTGQAADSRRHYALLLATPLAGAGYHGLGLLAGADADFAGAIELLAQAQQRDPTDAVVLSDLGYANLRAGRLAAARVPLMQAAQLLPDNPKVQANLALYLAVNRQGEQAEAVMAAQRLAPATRAAIRQAALELGAAPAPVPVSALSSRPAPAGDTPAGDKLAGNTLAADNAAPLSLRPASWPRRVHVLVREPSASTPAAQPLPDAPAGPAASPAALAAAFPAPSPAGPLALQPSVPSALQVERTASTTFFTASTEGSQ